MLKPQFFTQIQEAGNYGKFVIGPLPLSFGHSMGHSLRRTLLSSLKGAAITQVKIEGVSHIFSTISGVKESVLEIILNLKQLRFDIKDGGPFKINLNVKGSKKVFAEDFQGEIVPINKDLYIAEITGDKVELSIEAIVEVGFGYVSADDREDKKTGYIAIDAFFSPIKKVNFKVEETRVGRKTDYEKLILEIWTDESIKPRDALKDASNLLAEYFSYLLSGKDENDKADEMESEKFERENIDKKFQDIIIDELNLPSRVINALLREKIETIADLIKVGRDRLVNMKGVGKKSIELIEAELKKINIEL